MKKIYVGSFPGKIGGVTIKNELIFNEIKSLEEQNILKLNVSLLFNSFGTILKSINYLFGFRKRQFIIGLSSTNRNRFTNLLYYIRPRSLRESLLIIMGGDFSENIVETRSIDKYKKYKKIYVETTNNFKDLKNLGFENIILFPNPKKVSNKVISDQIRAKKEFDSNEKVKFVYLSQVSKIKGIDILFESYDLLSTDIKQKIEIDVYGDISTKEESLIRSNFKKRPEISYHGPLISKIENKIKLLGSYDVLLFPSIATTEGIPGVVIEAKFAGLPTVAFDVSNNSSIITTDYTGFIIDEVSPSGLSEVISEIVYNKGILTKMSKNVLLDSENFRIENFIQYITRELQND